MPIITFAIVIMMMMSIGDSMGGLSSYASSFIVLRRVRLSALALIAFIAACTMTNTAEWDSWSQNASTIRQ